MKRFDISITTAERLVYLKREWYPLIFIEELVLLTGYSKYIIQSHIDYLKSSRPPVVEYRAVKELTSDLCKICGAHAADGTLRCKYIAITDYYEGNILALIRWFKIFDYHPNLIKIGDNEYGIKFHSLIVSRYLTKIFDFPSGSKHYTVKEPDFIRNSSLELRKAFSLGALTFEAGLGIKTQIEFCVASRAFRDSIVEILCELKINHSSQKNRGKSPYWRFWSNTLTKDDARKWLGLFEQNTEKWFKLRDYIYGFSEKVSSFEEAIEILDYVYPEKSASKVMLKDVLLSVRTLGSACRYEMADFLAERKGLSSFGGTWAHSLKHYLDILKRANIVLIGKGEFGKKRSFGTIIREVYSFNENVEEWRLPERN